MSTFPERPESFGDVLNAILYHVYGYDALVPDFGTRMRRANPDGYSVTKEERDRLFELLIAFAVKERANG